MVSQRFEQVEMLTVAHLWGHKLKNKSIPWSSRLKKELL
jgi:hypothetical protein